MRTIKSLVGLAPMLVLAVLGSGCASGAGGGGGGGKMSSAKMCMAHGGTVNAAAKTCTYTPRTPSAQQICQAHDGYYDTAGGISTLYPWAREPAKFPQLSQN